MDYVQGISDSRLPVTQRAEHHKKQLTPQPNSEKQINSHVPLLGKQH